MLVTQEFIRITEILIDISISISISISQDVTLTDPIVSRQEFHAKPAPRRILEGPVGIPERRQVTVGS
jgi:hypothetical protein